MKPICRKKITPWKGVRKTGRNVWSLCYAIPCWRAHGRGSVTAIWPDWRRKWPSISAIRIRWWRRLRRELGRSQVQQIPRFSRNDNDVVGMTKTSLDRDRNGIFYRSSRHRGEVAGGGEGDL